MPDQRESNMFYGWWIVVAVFLNLFFAVGMTVYGFPVFYPSFVSDLHFNRTQVTQGFLLGFLTVGLPVGLVTGILIDKIGARWVILTGALLTGGSLVLMGFMHQFWQYQVLCIVETVGYVLAGPISNQVLIAQWFRERRGRAMGIAYVGLGLGGAVAPPAMNALIHTYGWRTAIIAAGVSVIAVLVPVAVLLTRSLPHEMGLNPDGAPGPLSAHVAANNSVFGIIGAALRDRNFWLIVVGASLVIGALNAVIQHFILFLKSIGYTPAAASRFLSLLLIASLAGRVIVGYVVDRFRKKNIMALFYFLLGAAIPLLFVAKQPVAAASFAIVFGFSMGADYMLIPLVTAECFGLSALGKLLALIIVAYSIGQWAGPYLAGRIFDTQHSYDLVWKIMAAAGVAGSLAIFAIVKRPGHAQA